MRTKKIECQVGGTLVKLEQDPETGAITGFLPQMWRYFNTGYYQNRWSMASKPTMPNRTVGGWTVRQKNPA
jgi:hypothetical protein